MGMFLLSISKLMLIVFKAAVREVKPGTKDNIFTIIVSIVSGETTVQLSYNVSATSIKFKYILNFLREIIILYESDINLI